MVQAQNPDVGRVGTPANKPQNRPPETLDAFARRTGQTHAKQSETRPAQRERVKLSEIKFPHKTGNMAAVRTTLQLIDAVLVSLVILVSVWHGYIGVNNHNVFAPLAAGISGAIGFFGALLLMKTYQFSPVERYAGHMKKVVLGAMAAVGLWLSLALMIKPDSFLPDALAFSGLYATLTLLLLHHVYYHYIRHQYEKGQLIPTIVMLGATEAARRLIEENARRRELNILAIFDERLSRAPHNIHGVPVVGKIQDMLEWEALPYVDRIVVTLPSMAETRKREFVRQVRKLPNNIAFVDDAFENLDHVHQRLSQIASVNLRDMASRSVSGRHIVAKRLMDIVISGTALLVLSPILALVALAIRLDSPGPILFKQKRQGFNNRVFDVFKFRSLKVDQQDRDARSQVTAGDSRVTRVGRFIRKTSIDELPQLFNVLKGDMSLVGPRPHAVGMHTGDVETYKLVDEYAHRLKVKPGLTGWAQINGSRGPLHDAESVARRVRLDLEYIERSNIWFDLMIMIKTIPCLLGDDENIR